MHKQSKSILQTTTVNDNNQTQNIYIEKQNITMDATASINWLQNKSALIWLPVTPAAYQKVTKE